MQAIVLAMRREASRYRRHTAWFLRKDVGIARSQGFFFPKRPPTLFTAFAGVCAPAPATPVARPPAQPACDLIMPAASPPASGTNFGSAVVPFIMNGMVVPPLHALLEPLPVTLPRPFATPETGLATTPMPLVSVAAILKSRSFFE